jgi:hypothetical protein
MPIVGSSFVCSLAALWWKSGKPLRPVVSLLPPFLQGRLRGITDARGTCGCAVWGGGESERYSIQWNISGRCVCFWDCCCPPGHPLVAFSDCLLASRGSSSEKAYLASVVLRGTWSDECLSHCIRCLSGAFSCQEGYVSRAQRCPF